MRNLFKLIKSSIKKTFLCSAILLLAADPGCEIKRIPVSITTQLVKENGKIKSVDVTFLHCENNESARIRLTNKEDVSSFIGNLELLLTDLKLAHEQMEVSQEPNNVK